MPQHQFATRPCLGRAPVIPAEAGIHRRRGRAPRARRNIVAGPQHFRRIPVAKALRIRCPDRSPPAMNPTTMRQFSTLSTDERRRARGLSPLPLRPHTRSDTAEVGPGALFQSVPFSSVRVLDLARPVYPVELDSPATKWDKWHRTEHFSGKSARWQAAPCSSEHGSCPGPNAVQLSDGRGRFVGAARRR